MKRIKVYDSSRDGKNPGFITLTKPKSQAFGMVYSDSGCGKSTFPLRFCPHPVAFINLDGRATHAVLESQNKYNRIIEYTSVDYTSDVSGLSTSQVKKIGKDSLKDLNEKLSWAVKKAIKKKIKTIVFDTATEVTTILNLTFRGRVDKGESDFGRSKFLMTTEVQNMFKLVRTCPAHFILLARPQPIWLHGEPTGRNSPRCLEAFVEGVDWACELWPEVNQNSIDKIKKLGDKKEGERINFRARMTKCGTNGSELLRVYESEKWKKKGPFLYICKKQYEGQDVSGWV